MIKRIIIPVDFSENSCRAAKYAVEELAPALGAEVVFVSVLEVSDLRVAMSHGLHGFETDEDVKRMVNDWIEEQFAKIESSAGNVKATRDIRRGLPEREILEAIKEHRGDLVVMGAHGMSHRNPIGGKSEYILAHSEVPLMLMPPTGD
jgi:nucleotide-binding universal stress UspA family protein